MAEATAGEFYLPKGFVARNTTFDGVVFIPDGPDVREILIAGCDLFRCDLSRLRGDQVRYCRLFDCQLPTEGEPDASNWIEPTGHPQEPRDLHSIIFAPAAPDSLQ